ncbi:hypothetical protein K458DRAFT_331071 [Lentithecium fluviatile CBS 122367]|uniref:Zn(2)-C6 fungal-type domain-containing protein n=1 Tax=Lentithecium fluviatile CBS 122367 TaxID=1168545 RepID=A0A6G1JDV9_9PLEO|nr:hypothetical protein K458DRAFT_331071 [Lentithecium fluviatile CBS 122367]
MMVAQRQPDRGANPKPRVRTWRPKSTTGCLTCKIRRVKCDEAKPSCNRCSSTGRKCDGYASPPQPASFPMATSPVTSVSPSHPLSCGRFASKEEGESFDFFMKYAVRDLCGFFNSPFWQRELLQATHYHPAIRHGVIAVGAMHRRYASGEDCAAADKVSDKQLTFALEQTNKAIQELTKSPEAASVTETQLKTIMTCCILFSTLACLHCEQQEALNHIRCGLKLMKELIGMVMCLEDPFASLYSHPVTLKSLRQTFLGLNVQALSMMSSTDLAHWEIIPAYFLENCPTFLTPWVSLECTQHYFESLLSNVLAFIQGTMELPSADSLETTDENVSEFVFAQLQQRFHTGIARLHRTFPDVYSRTADADAISVRLICAQVELFLMMTSPEGVRGDRFDDEGPFEVLMDLVVRLEELRVRHQEFAGGGFPRPVYSSTHGPSYTLFLVATRAPTLQLRKKAIGILLKNPRRDGLWDGPWAGMIAQEAMTLEENAARKVLGSEAVEQQIPSQFRIREIRFSYPGPKKVTVEFWNERAIERGERGWIKHFTK